MSDNPVSAEKSRLRQYHRQLRDQISQAQRTAESDGVRRVVLELAELSAAARVFVYASQGSEVQTYTLIEDLLAMGKAVAVPRLEDVSAGTMRAVPITSLKQLAPRPEHFGLLEPPAKAPAWGDDTARDAETLVLLPAVAVSPRTGRRVGSGAGYYDRYLAQHPASAAVALVYEAQLVDEVPAEPHDRGVAVVVTPARAIRVAG